MKNPTLGAGPFSVQTLGGEVNDDQLRELLVGKTLYLRLGYQENNLEFDEAGRLIGNSPQGSYTLSQIQINKVKLTKHKLELRGDRYALHFLGAAPYEDPMRATDHVKITPKKRVVRISFERIQVEKQKKGKDEKESDRKDRNEAAGAGNLDENSEHGANLTSSASDPALVEPTPTSSGSEDRPKATSPAQATEKLLAALDKVFSCGIDQRMITAMPDFWKLFYEAAEAKVDFKPGNPGVYRQSSVDQKARLISVLDPPSNEFAQANGIAGIALYHAVVGSDGKVQEVVAGRPIGFGLDESAEETIRKAEFQPALKDGKPVPVALDLVVSFRIYSKLTSQPRAQATGEKPNEPVLPGPYSIPAETQSARGSQEP